MPIQEILNYIPNKALEQLSVSYKVHYQVKKLHGQTMFQLLLFSMLNVKNNSLRVMEEFYHSLAFKSIANRNVNFLMDFMFIKWFKNAKNETRIC